MYPQETHCENEIKWRKKETLNPDVIFEVANRTVQNSQSGSTEVADTEAYIPKRTGRCTGEMG